MCVPFRNAFSLGSPEPDALGAQITKSMPIRASEPFTNTYTTNVVPVSAPLWTWSNKSWIPELPWPSTIAIPACNRATIKPMEKVSAMEIAASCR
eukprot:5677726-Prymnesium_polylepis.1